MSDVLVPRRYVLLPIPPAWFLSHAWLSVCLSVDSTREAIVAAGALAPAVSLLTPGSPADAHSYAVRLLLNIASTHSLRGAVVAAGGVAPLMKLVTHPVHPSVHSAVLDTLALLSTDPQVAQQVRFATINQFVKFLSVDALCYNRLLRPIWVPRLCPWPLVPATKTTCYDAPRAVSF